MTRIEAGMSVRIGRYILPILDVRPDAVRVKALNGTTPWIGHKFAAPVLTRQETEELALLLAERLERKKAREAAEAEAAATRKLLRDKFLAEQRRAELEARKDAALIQKLRDGFTDLSKDEKKRIKKNPAIERLGKRRKLVAVKVPIHQPDWRIGRKVRPLRVAEKRALAEGFTRKAVAADGSVFDYTLPLDNPWFYSVRSYLDREDGTFVVDITLISQPEPYRVRSHDLSEIGAAFMSLLDSDWYDSPECFAEAASVEELSPAVTARHLTRFFGLDKATARRIMEAVAGRKVR